MQVFQQIRCKPLEILGSLIRELSEPEEHVVQIERLLKTASQKLK